MICVFRKAEDCYRKLRLVKALHFWQTGTMQAKPTILTRSSWIRWVSQLLPQVSLDCQAMKRPGRKLLLNGRIIHFD